MSGSSLGSVRVKFGFRVKHVPVGFAFGSGGVWVGCVSGYVR